MKNLNRLHTVLIAVLVVMICLSIIPVITMAAQNTRTSNDLSFPTTAQSNPAQEEDSDIRLPLPSTTTPPVSSEPSTEPSEPSTEPSEPSTEPSEPSTEPSEPSTEPSEPSTEPSEPEGILGDFNADNEVNNQDVVYLLWHTLFPEEFPITGRGDFNADNEVTNQDVVYLLWHTLFPSDFPLV